MKRNYMVVYERITDDNWGGWTPDIGGAVGAGDSLELARKSLREGIAIQLEALSEQGLEPPLPAATSIDFSEFDNNPLTSHYEVEWMSVDLPGSHSLSDQLTEQAA